jgi:hypothetical protein
MEHKSQDNAWGKECMQKVWAEVGCKAHLPAGIVESLAVEPVLESLVCKREHVVTASTCAISKGFIKADALTNMLTQVLF